MSNHKLYLIIFFTINLLLSSYFLDGRPASAAVTRAAPALSLALEGTWNIDRYADLTVDKAIINGHYYLDKAPLASMVLTPFIFLLSKVKKFHLENQLDNMVNAIGLGSLVTGSLPFVLILVIFTITLANKINSLFMSSLLAMAIGYSSNLFIYSGALWGHMLTSLFLLMALILFDRKNFLISGIAMGLAVMAEYQVALYAIFMVAFILKNKQWDSLKKLVTGGAIPLLMILSYHYAFTGSPFKPLYMFEANEQFQAMSHGLGFSLPNLEIFWAYLFGLKRGILFYSPLLLLFLYIAIKEGRIKFLNINFLGSLSFLLLISSFFLWHGGYSHGPRYMVPVTCLMLYASLDLAPKFKEYKYSFSFLFLLGFLGNWIAKATHPIYGPDYQFPFKDHLWPLFISGDLTQSNLPNLALRTFKNGFSYLFPLVFLIGILFLYLVHRNMVAKKQ